MKKLLEHSLRMRLANEVHSRPYVRIKGPARVSHMAMLSSISDLPQERKHVSKLCEHYGVTQPAAEDTHFTAVMHNFTLKWERHTEFCTYTVISEGASDDLFENAAVDELPENWVSSLNGELITALHVVIKANRVNGPNEATLARCFIEDDLVGATIKNDAARLWTDYRVHKDGFVRFLMCEHDLDTHQTGRLLQQVLELETYRMLALLGFPLVQEYGPKLDDLSLKLNNLTQCMSRGKDDENELLQQLTMLEADIERILVETGYRFNATRAYFGIVSRHLESMRDTYRPGLQSIAQFLERRLIPAVATCESVAERQENISRRVARASQILVARVDLARKRQNGLLLQSMDRRANLQFRLQETVEGLSIAAISYYSVGLVAYVAKAFKSLGMGLSPDLVAGASIPFVVIGVWMITRRIKRHLIQAPSE
jgi:uncharacterized membrane-anchored protein